MGMSSTSKLIYGYELGDPDGEWKVAEYDEDKCDLVLPWYDADGDGFIEQAEKRLLAEIAGFTETNWQADGYFAREREAEKRVGVEFEWYCTYEFSGVILAAHVAKAYQGEAKAIDFAVLAEQAASSDWDAKLAAAIAALGITPKQGKPGWILCSMYG